MAFGTAKPPAILALEDGTVFAGYSYGAEGERSGEVVFNTGMTGYQEVLTDPSYCGQIVTMTYPLIGNYGVNAEDEESRKPFCEGFVVREVSRRASNWRSEGKLEDYLAESGVVAIAGIDTRALTRHIRSAGALTGVLSSIEADPNSLVEKARKAPGLMGRDLVCDVCTKDAYEWEAPEKARFKVVAFDFGIKRNILRCLSEIGASVTVVPARTSAEQILGMNPDGVFLSNGPGDPEPVSYAVEAVHGLLGKKPVFGICLGHQILGLALGGRTYKLKFGHRGANQPVMNFETGRVEITAQNHGFAVDFDSLGPARPSRDRREVRATKGHGDVELSHVNLNDRTVEGLRCMDVNAFSVQYHPESSPGPHDSRYLFDRFAAMMGDGVDKGGG